MTSSILPDSSVSFAKTLKPWNLGTLKLLPFLVLLAILFACFIEVRNGNARPPFPTEEQVADSTRAAATAMVATPRMGFSQAFLALLPHVSDGTTPPLYPWLNAILSGAEPNTTVMAERGRWVQFGIIAFAMIAWVIVCLRKQSPSFSCAALVVIGGAIIPSMGLYSPRALFIPLYAATWLEAASLCRYNPTWRYARLGLMFGLSVLLDAGVFVLGLGFLTITTVRFIRRALPRFLTSTFCQHSRKWAASNHLIGLTLLFSFFVLPNVPRFISSQEQYGVPIYSQAHVTRWLETPEEAADWAAKHPDIRAVPEEEQPSFSSYLSKHTVIQTIGRLWRGGESILAEFKIRSDFARKMFWLFLALQVLSVVMIGAILLYWLQQERDLVPLPQYLFSSLPLILMTVGFGFMLAAWDHTVFPSPARFIPILAGASCDIMACGERYRKLLQQFRHPPPKRAAIYYNIARGVLAAAGLVTLIVGVWS